MQDQLARVNQAVKVLEEVQQELIVSAQSWVELRAKHRVLEVSLSFRDPARVEVWRRPAEGG